MKFITLCLFFVLRGIAAQAQEKLPASFASSDFLDSADAVLPVLIDAALKNAPQMAELSLTRQDAENNLKLSKKEFIRNFSLHSGYNYGNYNTVFANNGGQPIPVYGFYGDRSQSTYTAGASIGINLEQLLGGKKLRVQKQKLALQLADTKSKEGEQEIRRQVITFYQNVKLSRAVYQHSQDALQTAFVNKTLSEKHFKEGTIQVTEQMSVDQLYTNALLAAEQAKNAYQTNVLLLEELVGIPVLPLINQPVKK